MKNFEEFYKKNETMTDKAKKIFEAEGNFDVINNDLKSEIKEYLLTEYPSDWWNSEFQESLPNYISDEDYIGYDGDEDDESTWEYESPEEAYRNLCTGGAIEYDLLDEIRKDVRKHFHLSEEEYDRNKIGEIVEDHMCNMIDWYDKMIFGESAGDFLGFGNNKHGLNWG